MPKGLLIALEGIDGTGLTTQAGRLVSWLRSTMPAHGTKEPSDGPVGRLIRQALRGTGGPPLAESAMALLFAADRIDHAATVIAPRQAAGEAVVTDRYLLSSYAYQSLELDLDWIMALNRQAPLPDLTLLLTVDPRTSRDRIARRDRRERYEDLPRLEAVLANYLRLAERLEDLLHIRIVDGSGSAEEVSRRVREAVRPLLPRP